MTSKPKPSLITGDDDVKRCGWCGNDPTYIAYHDHEWGMPVRSDQKLFEKMCLEGFQAGLSWITILKRRPGFRKHFARFSIRKVAQFTHEDVDRLVQEEAIIRHRGKIESTINNAARATEIIEKHGSLARFFWGFEPSKHRSPRSVKELVATTKESTAMSKELKKAGWSFVGPTTCYALMQAMGIVNDHFIGCDQWQPIEDARDRFERPS